jgi:acyl-CoA thioesterase-1
MTFTRPTAASPVVSRRRLFCWGLGWGAASLMPSRGLAAAAKPKIVTLLGDSITAGLGLPAKDALPAQLEAALLALKVPVRVRGAGVSGDTSGGGLARVDFSVASDTAVCVVALGGNDLLQGAAPAATRANLKAIITRLKARRIKVVLAGMRAPNAIGAGYAKAFNGLYPSLAKEMGVAFYPFLLEGVASNKRLNQKDGIHPTAEGVKIISQRLAPVVAQALKQSP